MSSSRSPSSSEDGAGTGLSVGAGVIPRLLSGLGVAFVGVVLAEWIVFAELQVDRILAPVTVAGVGSNLPFILGLLYGGYWLERSDLPPERYGRIAGWCVGSMIVFVSLNGLSIVATELESLWMIVGWVRWAAVIGSGTGLLVGVIEARAIERERVAERSAARAEYVESQRDQLDYLNSLLRHEVLNATNIIDGHASLLMTDLDPDDPGRERLEVIRRQTRNMDSVIDDVRVLLDATAGAHEFEPRDLAAVLRTEVAALRDRYEGVDVDLTAPADVTVMADDLLPRLFSNLLENAVEHNDSETPRVRVTVDPTAETVLVRVSDNGPGIPPAMRDALFEREPERRSDHGLGLYLVRTLAERYGGSVELTESGDEGSTFTVELPRADADTDRDADVHTDTNADIPTDTDADVHTDRGTFAGTDTDAETDDDPHRTSPFQETDTGVSSTSAPESG